ncbi:unnamed protein product [Didymodactylos carnosus]|uniref:Peptidase S53 domain-containing protein n=1 Tax=Didymodactylos carnosus TaxID=1234261 RepID=A0A815QDZ6_9BILA|nr:unnamed protein product [Didymodactylos carnosus]CAF1460503.1 unnamed protein product [Didymodactylos carnosus]CAF4090924.1 unnamed protein product [Didymodactylos carnosus]CAF4330874.1 unnamed protein product [Didymodactylos carnosus]
MYNIPLFLCALILHVSCGHESSKISHITTVVQVPTNDWTLVKHAQQRDRHITPVKLTLIIKNEPRQVERLKVKFNKVSNPSHSDYGNYMSYDDLHKQYLKQTTKHGRYVARWLKQQHPQLRIKPTPHKEFIIIKSSISTIERVFQTKLNIYKHNLTGERIIRATHFKLPSNIHHRISYIEGLSQFPPTSRIINSNQMSTVSSAPILFHIRSAFSMFTIYVQLVCFNGDKASNSLCNDNFKGFEIMLRPMKQSGVSPIKYSLSQADSSCMICKYGIPSITNICNVLRLSNDSVLCVFDLTDDSIPNFTPYMISIRSKFFDMNSKIVYSQEVPYLSPVEKVVAMTPDILASLYNISGTNKPTSTLMRQAVVGFRQYLNKQSFYNFAKAYGNNFNLQPGKIYGDNYQNKSYDELETSLDLQYLASMGSGIPTDYISASQNFDGFLIDFFVQLAFLEQKKYIVMPLVYSISYGDSENEIGRSLVQICDFQFMKMGLTGKSVFVAAGDSGTSFVDNVCRDNFVSIYPASSPYITSVGGTQLIGSDDNECKRYIAQAPNICLEEIVAYTTPLTGCSITSGGGFSTFSMAPEYQKKHIDDYFQIGIDTLPPVTFFNNSNRAYPDLSLLAFNYMIKMNGNQDTAVDGTSASTPAIAGLFSSINDRRLQYNMKPLGFLNPLLYQLAEIYPEVFYDITKGGNNCNRLTCCKYGFSAQKGYDPVSGLGSINYDRLMKLLTQ